MHPVTRRLAYHVALTALAFGLYVAGATIASTPDNPKPVTCSTDTECEALHPELND